jgi:hypothetical protein
MILALVLVVLGVTGGQAPGRHVVHRDLTDAFLDDFNYTGGTPFGPPIRAKMPFNVGDPDRNLLGAIRVDSFQSIIAGGQYGNFEELLAAFYANQHAFNIDADRDRIRMTGTIREVREADGDVLAIVDITYHQLPLNVYTFTSWKEAFAVLDLTLLKPVLVDGTLSGDLHLTFVLPYPGAPLEYWKLETKDDFRFIANGDGWLVDESGARSGRARVHVHQSGREGSEDGRSEVRLISVDD